MLYAKTSNKRFIIPLQKKYYFAIGFYFVGKSIQKHPLIPSVKMTLTMVKLGHYGVLRMNGVIECDVKC